MERIGRATGAAEFCAAIRPSLIGSLGLYCGDRHVGEELAQDVLARVWDRWAQVSALPSQEAWTHRVAINLANSHFRRRAAERRASARAREGVSEGAWSDPADAVAVRTAISSLPRRQRAALVLRFYLDLSVEDAARQMGCAEGTVKALTHQGIAGLRAVLGEGMKAEEARNGMG